MHSFKDRQGREWKLEATFGSYGRVKSATGVKLYDIATENRESLVQLADAFTLGSVLWSMIEPQAEARGVTPDDFAEAIDGTVLTDAYSALIDEMIFFCHPRQRKVLETALERIREAEARADRMVDENLPEIKREIDGVLDRWTRGDSDTSWPESSVFTPPSGRSASLSTPSRGYAASSGITPAPSSPS